MAYKCYAPVFEATEGCGACLLLSIVYALAIVALIIGTLFLCLFIESCQCKIKQLQYRIKNCGRGNSDTNVLI